MVSIRSQKRTTVANKNKELENDFKRVSKMAYLIKMLGNTQTNIRNVRTSDPTKPRRSTRWKRPMRKSHPNYQYNSNWYKKPVPVNKKPPNRSTLRKFKNALTAPPADLKRLRVRIAKRLGTVEPNRNVRMGVLKRVNKKISELRNIINKAEAGNTSLRRRT